MSPPSRAEVVERLDAQLATLRSSSPVVRVVEQLLDVRRRIESSDVVSPHDEADAATAIACARWIAR